MFQVLGLSENEDMEDRIMRDNLALDLQIGLKNSQVDGEEIVTCQASVIHARPPSIMRRPREWDPNQQWVPHCGGTET